MNSTPGMVNGLNPATAAAYMINGEPGMEMLPQLENGVGAAGSAGATPPPGISNLGLHNGSAMYNNLPNNGMLPSGGNHNGSATPDCGTHGSSPGLISNATVPTGHISAGNRKRRCTAQSMVNNE